MMCWALLRRSTFLFSFLISFLCRAPYQGTALQRRASPPGNCRFGRYVELLVMLS